MSLFGTKEGFDNTPKIQVTLTKSGIITRIVFMIITLIMAAYAFYSVFAKVLRTEAGWQTINMNSKDTSAGSEFSLNYELGVTGRAPASEYAALTKLYSNTLDKHYKSFSTYNYEGVKNLYILNHNPNTEVVIDHTLYEALDEMSSFNCRYMYYAPIFEIYKGLFGCDYDFQAYDYNPLDNSAIAQYIQQVLAFVTEETHINIEFKGEDKVVLHVSEDYLRFAKANEIQDFLDLYRMKNAWILDCTAKELIKNGYTAGIITCVEGYSRALGEGSYSVNRYDLSGGQLSLAETVNYEGPKSVIALHRFPVTEADYDSFYITEEGVIFTPFIDLYTGIGITEGDSRGEILMSDDSVVSILFEVLGE